MNDRKKVLLIFGTRPEAIKFAPLYDILCKNNNLFETKICLTSQHREMLDPVMSFFNIKPDHDLNIMKPDQTQFDVITSCLLGLEKVLDVEKPDLIMVQGDTTTTFAGSLAGYLKKIKIAHIEAGLRSYNKYSPFPEEMNRVLAGHLADYHFAPTMKAKDNLSREGIHKNVFIVGNTGIDALFQGIKIINDRDRKEFYSFFSDINFNKRIVLITGHRRESFGEPFQNICQAIKNLSEIYPDIEFVYPVHLNPNVHIVVNKILLGIDNVHLLNPLDYPYMLWLLQKSYLVLTDSGGIQEEAPSLGKPVLVMREVTERTEGVEAGNAIIVGTLKDNIIKNASQLLNQPDVYDKMANSINPYGDGHASERILDILIENF